jgi:hypothetical protein
MAMKNKSIIIRIIRRESELCFEMSRIPHFLNSRLTDGGEIVSLTRRIYSSERFCVTHFC